MATSDFQPTAEMIDAVAAWHQHQPADRVRRPLIPHLRDCFKLDNAQALAVIRASSHPDESKALKEQLAATILGNGGAHVA